MRKTSVVSIRINDDEKGLLSVEGDLEGITLNALIGKIITKHIKWDKFSRERNNVCINKNTLRFLLNNLDASEFDKLCKTNSIMSMKDAILFSRGDFTFDNFLNIFDLWLDSSNISYRHISTDGYDKYIIKHQIGLNFSKLLNILVEQILTELQIRLSNMKYDEGHVSFEVDRIKAVD